MANWIVGGVVVVIVGLIIRSMVRDKRAGKSACGGNCANCHAACSGKPR